MLANTAFSVSSILKVGNRVRKIIKKSDSTSLMD